MFKKKKKKRQILCEDVLVINILVCTVYVFCSGRLLISVVV